VTVEDHVIRLAWSKAGVIAAACIGGPIHLLRASTGITLDVLETLIAILEGPGRRRQFKFHKPIAEIPLRDVESVIRSS
jgi:hypothetical protein